MLAAIAFLTPLPVGRTRRPTGWTLLWFPVVGAMLGGVVGLVWRFLDKVSSGQGLLVGVLVVAVDLALTGALHFDGLVDSADGLFAPGHGPQRGSPGGGIPGGVGSGGDAPEVVSLEQGRSRRLAIMAGPEIGAFGLATGVLALLLRIVCLALIDSSPLLLIGLWCASRTVMAAVAGALPYARPEGGMASAFLDGMPGPLAIGGAGVLLAVGAAAGAGIRGPLAVMAGLIAALGVALLARHRLGGFTGDVLGACGFVCETVGLLVMALR